MLEERGMIFEAKPPNIFVISIWNKPQNTYQEMKSEMCTLCLMRSLRMSKILQSLLFWQHKQQPIHHNHFLFADSYSLSWIWNLGEYQSISMNLHAQGQWELHPSPPLCNTTLFSNNILTRSLMETSPFLTCCFFSYFNQEAFFAIIPNVHIKSAYWCILLKSLTKAIRAEASFEIPTGEFTSPG